jgi:hypothetical protein
MSRNGSDPDITLFAFLNIKLYNEYLIFPSKKLRIFYCFPNLHTLKSGFLKTVGLPVAEIKVLMHGLVFAN